MIKHKQGGFGAVGIVIFVVVLAILAYTTFRVFDMKSPRTAANTSNTNQNDAIASQTASSQNSANCSAKPTLPLPVDISAVTGILYPGQIRGGNYKPHGGFRFANSANTQNVTLPLPAKLIDGARYIEQGEVQYLLDFEADCNYRMRFDHLQVLSAELQAEADTLPAAKVDDSRTTNLSGKSYKAGTVLATEVGFSKNGNASVDFGLYDFSRKNDASNNVAWLAAHRTDNEQHGVCWFDYLSATDKTAILALPAVDMTSGKTSDYCK